MEPVTVILGGLVVTIISGTIGKYIGGNGKMSEGHCNEKRESCQILLVSKIDNVAKKVDELAKLVNAKTSGV